MPTFQNKVLNYKKYKLAVVNFLFRNKRIIITSLFILFYISIYFLIDSSNQSLVAHDEGLYARRARLVEDSDNWFSSPFLSAHHKTLGSYWFIALSIRLFGNSELALRLPSILSSFLCLFISYLIALKITNKKAALISLFSLSTMPLWIKYSRYASPDLPFVLCILLAIFFFLKSIDNDKYSYHYFYIFCSGFFISISFFIRSYMAFVPLIGLSPFLIFHLFRNKHTFKVTFFFGIIIGSIPTCLNLYFAFSKFGITGIYSLFDFAKKQAIGGFSLNKLLLIPFNFIYLTFPIGLLIIILFAFTKSNNRINYPLLAYFFPLLSLFILLSMSTSYPHYYLFLLPSLTNLFAFNLTSFSFRFSFSKFFIKFLLFLSLLLIIFSLIFYIINYKEFIINNSNGNPSLLYIVSLFLFISYLSSIRFLIDNKKYRFNLIRFLYNIVFPQYIFLSLLYNFGFLGNPNFNTKSFLNDKIISSITKSNTIYLYNVESKIQTLLSYYLPSSKIVYSIEDISMYKYIITSNNNSLDNLSENMNYKSIKKFDNYSLLMNISK